MRRPRLFSRQTAAYCYLGTLVLIIFALPFATLVMVAFGVVPGFGESNAGTLDGFRNLLDAPFLLSVLHETFLLTGLVTLAAMLLALPLGYMAARCPGRPVALLWALLALPFGTGDLVLNISWQQTLASGGFIYEVLAFLNVSEALRQNLLYSQFAVWLVHLHASLPMAVVVVHMAFVDRSDASPLWLLHRIVLLSYFLVAIPLIGEFSGPHLVGNSGGALIANVIERQFVLHHSPTTGAAVSIIVLSILTLTGAILSFPLLFFRRSKVCQKTTEQRE